MNRKGISAVVATILIVLLSVVAVVIIWVVLKPAITRTAGQVSTNCLEVDLSIDSVDCANQKATVTLNTGKVANLTIVMTNGTDSISQIVTAPDTLGTKTYTLTGTIDAASLTTVRIAPRVLLADGTEKLCENPVTKTC